MSGALTPDLTDGMPFQSVFSRLRQCRSRACLWRETIPKLCRFVNPAKRHITPKIPLPELPFFMNFLFSSSFAPQNRGFASSGYLAGYRHIGSGNVIQPSRAGRRYISAFALLLSSRGIRAPRERYKTPASFRRRIRGYIF